VTFNVSGVNGTPTGISTSITFGSPNHTWMGDVVATLIAPNGANHIVFGRTGSTTGVGVGDSSDLGGTYIFSDTASNSPSGGWWQESNVRGAAEVMTSGIYRTTGIGGLGVTNPAPFTNMDADFAGVTNANGTWTLRLTDGCQGDTGAVSAASLTLNGSAPAAVKHDADYNGDGKTDYALIRANSGNLDWFVWDGLNPASGYSYNRFGLAATDYIIAADFDGDNKTDISVWREAAAGSAGFYILQSATNTVRFENFGQNGDDPAVVADYDGDGKADPATFRCPALTDPDGQCYYFYRGSLNNPSGSITYNPWGFGIDGDFFLMVGDFDGDHKADLCLQRADPAAPTQGQFVLHRSSDNGVEFINWGLSSDFLIPGDYDGDGKSDLCVRRSNAPSAGLRTYYVLTRTGSVMYQQWGITGDQSVPGDYDGDGKTDFAVWRGSTTSGQSAFYVLNSSTQSLGAVAFGQCASAGSCDFGAAGWAVH